VLHAHHGKLVKSTRLTSLWTAFAAALTGCEPCSGVTNCGTTHAVHIEGRVVDQIEGWGIPEARISIVFRDGSVVSTVTNDDGLFEGTIDADSAGKFIYDLLVAPPADSTFLIRNLTCEVRTGVGDGCPLGRIVSRPYFSDFIRIAYRDAEGAVVSNAEVTFRRKSGGPIYGKAVRNDSIINATEAGGYVVLFPSVYTTDVVPLVGDLTVKLPPPFDSTIVTDFVVRSRTGFFEPVPPYEVQVGPTLRSTALFYRGTPSVPTSGVKVTFTRTGGIAIAGSGLTAVSDSSGKAVLRPRPLARGTVTGTLLVEPPAPAQSFTITGVTLTTHDDDTAPLVLSHDLDPGGPLTKRTGR
jgi:hypothetical protein